jgi:hypothetical protein
LPSTSLVLLAFFQKGIQFALELSIRIGGHLEDTTLLS